MSRRKINPLSQGSFSSLPKIEISYNSTQKTKLLDELFDDFIVALRNQTTDEDSLINTLKKNKNLNLSARFSIICENKENHHNIVTLAAKLKKYKLLSYVLQTVDANLEANDGNNALLTSSYEGDLEGCKLLVRHGANVNKYNRQLVSPLMGAASNKDCFKYLLEQGADIYLLDQEYNSVLEYCYIHNKLENFKSVLDRLDPNKIEGSTMLDNFYTRLIRSISHNDRNFDQLPKDATDRAMIYTKMLLEFSIKNNCEITALNHIVKIDGTPSTSPKSSHVVCTIQPKRR